MMLLEIVAALLALICVGPTATSGQETGAQFTELAGAPTVVMPMDLMNNGVVEGGTYDLVPNVGQMNLTTGFRGQGVYFDGQTNAILGDRRDSCFWNPEMCPDGFTTSLWLNIGNKGGRELYVYSNGGQTKASYGTALLLKDRKLQVTIRTTSRRYRAWGDLIIQPGTWYHVVFTWSTSEGVMLYVNGTPSTATTLNDNISPVSNEFNKMVFGSTNTHIDSYYHLWAEFTIDELVFIPKWTLGEVAKQVYQQYTDIPEVNTCYLPKDEGTGSKMQEKYFYDKDTRQCQTMTYKGEGGNDNNYPSKKKCEKACKYAHLPARCKLPKDVGSGSDTTPSIAYYFSTKDGKCRKLKYSGAGGNNNNFASKSECKKTCQ